MLGPETKSLIRIWDGRWVAALITTLFKGSNLSWKVQQNYDKMGKDKGNDHGAAADNTYIHTYTHDVYICRSQSIQFFHIFAFNFHKILCLRKLLRSFKR